MYNYVKDLEQLFYDSRLNMLTLIRVAGGVYDFWNFKQI
jgi:hypothetical protein